MINTITQETLNLHKMYINGEPGGIRLITIAGIIRIETNLSGADLSRADLSDANLSRADLREANLSEANLREANLSEADLDFSCWPLTCVKSITRNGTTKLHR